MVCIGLGSNIDDLGAELLTRTLLADKLDARHFALEDAAQDLPPDATPDAVAIVYLVSAYPSPERQNSGAVVEGARQRLPGAQLVKVFLPGYHRSWMLQVVRMATLWSRVFPMLYKSDWNVIRQKMLSKRVLR